MYPAVNYAIVDLPGGSRELVFPALVPGEQVNVTYLYFPPVVWSNVNSYTKSDEGFAKIINVLPTPQFSPWLTRITWALLIIGGTTVLVGIGQVVALIVRHLRAA